MALRPVSGGNASGTAIFGLATGDQPYVDVSVKGLDPAPADRTYVIWLMLTGDKGYPLSPLAVSENGTLPGPLSRSRPRCLPIVARVRYVDVSIAPISAIRKLVSKAIKSTALVIDEPGEVVLRGRIPKAAGPAGRQRLDRRPAERLSPGSSLPGFMIPAGSRRSLSARRASIPSSPTSARM